MKSGGLGSERFDNSWSIKAYTWVIFYKQQAKLSHTLFHSIADSISGSAVLSLVYQKQRLSFVLHIIREFHCEGQYEKCTAWTKLHCTWSAKVSAMDCA